MAPAWMTGTVSDTSSELVTVAGSREPMRSRMFLTINVRMPFCAITDPHQYYYYATRCRPSALQVAVPPARVMGQTRRAHARTIPDEFPPPQRPGTRKTALHRRRLCQMARGRSRAELGRARTAIAYANALSRCCGAVSGLRTSSTMDSGFAARRTSASARRAVIANHLISPCPPRVLALRSRW